MPFTRKELAYFKERAHIEPPSPHAIEVQHYLIALLGRKITDDETVDYLLLKTP